MVSPPALPSLIRLRSAWSTRCPQPLPPSPWAPSLPLVSMSPVVRKLVRLFTRQEDGEGQAEAESRSPVVMFLPLLPVCLARMDRALVFYPLPGLS